MGVGILKSTWALADSSRHGSNWLRSTLTQIDLAWHGYGSTWVDMGSVSTQPWAGANSTWALTHSAGLGSGLTRLDFGLGRLGPALLDSTWVRADLAQQGLRLTSLNLGLVQVKIQFKIQFGLFKNVSNPYLIHVQIKWIGLKFQKHDLDLR